VNGLIPALVIRSGFTIFGIAKAESAHCFSRLAVASGVAVAGTSSALAASALRTKVLALAPAAKANVATAAVAMRPGTLLRITLPSCSKTPGLSIVSDNWSGFVISHLPITLVLSILIHLLAKEVKHKHHEIVNNLLTILGASVSVG
jgi:hypothetical protein